MSDRAVFIYGGKTLGEGTPGELARQFKGRVYRLGVAPSAEGFAELARIPSLGARRFGASVYIYVGATEPIESFYDRLSALGIAPATVEETSASLEDAFIQLMGT
jgi:ABC-type multidrug transport system ATPase subunit